MTTKKIISIIGGGAVGVSILYQLIKKNIDTYYISGLEINIFEKNLSIGRGLAYGHDSEINLLNRPIETMSAVHGNQNDFIDWLSNNNHWKKSYPNIHIDKNKGNFLPRSLFGMYLESLFADSLEIAKNNGIKINIIYDEVINLQKNKNKFFVVTKNGNSYLSHSVVLALGQTNSRHYDHLKLTNKYFESPYPTTLVRNEIPKNASIAIIGSRLSAIDSAIALCESGHQGEITFISRNGYLPSVRPHGIFNYKLKILTAKNIDELSHFGATNIKLKQIVKLLEKEFYLATGKSQSIKEWFSRPKDPILYLKNELFNLDCHDSIIWQSIMIAMNNVIELIWHKLSNQDKKIFIKRYRSRWMAYRVGIPLQNAKKILSLMESGKITSVNSLNSISYNKNIEKFVIQFNSNSTNKIFEYAINATGSCSEIKNSQSSLLLNMMKNGFLQPSQFGGMNVDFSSSKIIDRNGVADDNLYAIGTLTEGTYFFTSVLELNINHANTISDYILDYIKSTLYKSDNLSTLKYSEGKLC